MMCNRLVALLMTTALVIGTAILPARAQLAVFDASVYARNVLEATRALEQVNNQIRSLQNEAIMLENMAKHLERLDVSQLDAMVSALGSIGGLMDQGQGIAFDIDAMKTAFARYFPQSYGTATREHRVGDAHARWQNAMAAFEQTLTVQAQVVRNVEADAVTLSSLVTASQGASGNLEAQQATNQLIALSTKQQLQIQSLMAAQYRATALEQARNAEDEEAARAAFMQFIGSANAYTRH